MWISTTRRRVNEGFFFIVLCFLYCIYQSYILINKKRVFVVFVFYRILEKVSVLSAELSLGHWNASWVWAARLMALLVTSEYTKDLYGPNVAYTSFGKDKSSSCQTIDSQGWVGGAHRGGTMGEMIKTDKKNLEKMLKLVVGVLAWCWCPAVHLKVKMLHKNWVCASAASYCHPCEYNVTWSPKLEGAIQIIAPLHSEKKILKTCITLCCIFDIQNTISLKAVKKYIVPQFCILEQAALLRNNDDI